VVALAAATANQKAVGFVHTSSTVAAGEHIDVLIDHQTIST
jgi:hypothetical protein